MAESLLNNYLRDHYAGAAGGRALARRMVAAPHPEWAEPELRALCREIEEDHDALESIMSSLAIAPDPIKRLIVVVAERVGRLKLNGRFISRSPLSFVVELEGLRMGVEGKASGWRTLREVAAGEPRLDPDQLTELVRRAEDQSARLERLRVRAAREALSG